MVAPRNESPAPRARSLIGASAMAAAALLAVTGCTGGGDGGDSKSPSSAPTTVAPTPLQGFDTSSLVVQRADFCDRVEVLNAEDAVGGTISTDDAYGSGEPLPADPATAPVPKGKKAPSSGASTPPVGVSHEWGCIWTGKNGVTARAWVFAPPASVEDAKRFVRLSNEREGCERPKGAVAFGRPGTASVCAGKGGSVTTYQGLFGDAWLGCSISTPASVRPAPKPAEVTERTGRFCVAALTAASSAS